MDGYPSYLVHYGTKGQRWGSRKYQNADGSLTAEGKLRYRKGYRDWSGKASADKGDALIDRANKWHQGDSRSKQVARARRHIWGRAIKRNIGDNLALFGGSIAGKMVANSYAQKHNLDESTRKKINSGIDTIGVYGSLALSALRTRDILRDYASIERSEGRRSGMYKRKKNRQKSLNKK